MTPRRNGLPHESTGYVPDLDSHAAHSPPRATSGGCPQVRQFGHRLQLCHRESAGRRHKSARSCLALITPPSSNCFYRTVSEKKKQALIRHTKKPGPVNDKTGLGRKFTRREQTGSKLCDSNRNVGRPPGS